MRFRVLFPDFIVISSAIACLLLLPSLGATSEPLEVTEENLQGDYDLKALDIDYGGAFPPSLDEDDFSQPLNGYFSATAKSMLFEHSGKDNVSFNVYLQRTAGEYELLGDAAAVRSATVSRANEFAETVTLRIPSSDTLIVTGSAFDSNQDEYQYTYEFSRTETYYSQKQLDDAIKDATADLFTQEEVDAAVEEALEKVKPQAVVIPLFD